MPKKNTYTVKALERFCHRTTYYVEAQSAEEAERLCRSGDVAYEDAAVLVGSEEWLETVNVEVVDLSKAKEPDA